MEPVFKIGIAISVASNPPTCKNKELRLSAEDLIEESNVLLRRTPPTTDTMPRKR